MRGLGLRAGRELMSWWGMGDQQDPDEGFQPTQRWPAGATSEVYRLSAEDRQVVSGLREGTAMLVGISGPLRGSRILLWRPEIRVGRGKECLVWLPSRSASRHHATLIRRETTYELVDAGSLNGSHVNRSPVECAVLDHGDEIAFADCRFLYFRGAEAEVS